MFSEIEHLRKIFPNFLNFLNFLKNFKLTKNLIEKLKFSKIFLKSQYFENFL